MEIIGCETKNVAMWQTASGLRPYSAFSILNSVFLIPHSLHRVDIDLDLHRLVIHILLKKTDLVSN